MMSTQVIRDESGQIIMDVEAPATEQVSLQMEADQRVDKFKNTLLALRLKTKVFFSKRKKAFCDLQDMLAARGEILDFLINEARTVYPELQGQTNDEILSTISRVSEGHPLSQIWGKFRSSIVNMDRQLARKFVEYKEYFQNEQNSINEEEVLKREYQEFKDQSLVAVPEVSMLVEEAETLEMIPMAEEASLLASVEALYLLDDEARAMIEKELSSQIAEFNITSLADAEAAEGFLKATSPRGEFFTSPVVKWGAIGFALWFLFGGKK